MRKLIRAGCLGLAFFSLACQTPGRTSSERLVIENYNQPLKELVASAGFDEVWPPGILDKITWVDQAKELERVEVNPHVAVQLIHLDVLKDSEGAVIELAIRDQRPGTFVELMALAKAKPTLQLEFPIVALGSRFVDVKGAPRVAFIFKNEKNKRALFFVVPTEWGEDCRFLFAPKHPVN